MQGSVNAADSFSNEVAANGKRQVNRSVGAGDRVGDRRASVVGNRERVSRQTEGIVLCGTGPWISRRRDDLDMCGAGRA
jgi:hypothetical protein